ncbi:hypothetical protein VQL36_16470 [Chengkuizengella sp. SCS-71B]|uniref:hypothetical protein n=1 Tax=Chengkuizengella sp. SCS-71B TaxID=3115290 RepID=UPI0032C23DD1
MPYTPFYNMRYPAVSQTNFKAEIKYYFEDSVYTPPDSGLKFKDNFNAAIAKWKEELYDYVGFEEIHNGNDQSINLRIKFDDRNHHWIEKTDYVVEASTVISTTITFNKNYLMEPRLKDYQVRLNSIALNAIGNVLSLLRVEGEENYEPIMRDHTFRNGQFLLPEQPSREEIEQVQHIYGKAPGDATLGDSVAYDGYPSYFIFEENVYFNPQDVFYTADLVFMGIVKEKKNIFKQDEDYWMTYKVRVDHKVKGKLADPYEVEIHQYGSDEGGNIPALHNLRYLQAGDSIVFMGNYKENGILSAVNEGDGLFVKHLGSDRFVSSLEGSPLSNVQFSLDQLLGCHRRCKC